jgi:16S rRNA (uracil1498-N3)-methyltransferase
MTRRRWIADRTAGNRAYLTGQNADHLARVLRARPGQQFDIALGEAVRTGTIVAISPDEVEFELGAEIPAESLPEVSVFLSIFKFDRMEWAIEKLTELGVTTIFPVITRRTESHLAKSGEKRVERWRKIVHEASQQSRRLTPATVQDPVPLEKAMQQTSGCRIVLSEIEDQVSFKSSLANCQPPITLAIGPEGGWTSEELELFRASGWVSTSLGNTILRTETAVIAAMAIVMSELAHDSYRGKH